MNSKVDGIPQILGLTDLQGIGIPIDIEESRERWSEYQLRDGTTLKLKPVVIEVRRLDGQVDAEGNPVYVIKNTLVTVNETKKK